MAQRSIPATMPAAVLRGPRDIAVEDRPVPEIGDDDVLVEVSHCGICGSDLHMVIEGWGKPGAVGGHEYSGVVVAAGPRVDGWEVGDRVVSGPRARCGACKWCRAGRPWLCVDREPIGVGEHQGAFAAYARLHVSELHRIPDGLDLRTAALTEPLAVAIHGVT